MSQNPKIEVGLTEGDGRRRRGAKARALILTRAMNMASVHGLEGLTIGTLASDAGVGKGNISILFGDREGLQIATLDAATEVFKAKVVTPSLHYENALERLQHLIDGWFDYVERRSFPGGCFLYASISEFRARPGRIQDRVEHHRKAWIGFLGATVRDAQKDGQIRADVDPDQLVFELTAFQSAANSSALLGDQVTFARARRTSQEKVAAAATRPSRRQRKSKPVPPKPMRGGRD